MQKVSQKRKFLDEIKDYTNISGAMAEKFFQPELLRIMQSLRKFDNDIRSIGLGKSVDGGNPGLDSESIKNLLKSAKSHLARREYINAVSDLGRFHKKFLDISTIISNIKFDVSKIHHHFLFQDVKKDRKRLQHLKELNKRWASEINDQIVKQAGLMDFYVNNFTRKGRALAAWEKRYPRKVEKIKDSTLDMISNSQYLYDYFLQSLDLMSKARSERDIDAYFDSANDFSKSFRKYDAEFKQYYTTIVKPLVEESGIFTELEEESLPGSDKKQEPVERSPLESSTLESAPQPAAQPATQSSPFASSVKTPYNANTPEFISFPKPNPPSTVSDLQFESTKKAPIVNQQNAPQTRPEQQAIMFQPGSIPSGTPDTDVDPPPATLKSPTVENTESNDPQLSLFNKKTHRSFLNSLEALSGESPQMLKIYIKKYAKKIENFDFETSIKLLKIANSIKV